MIRSGQVGQGRQRLHELLDDSWSNTYDKRMQINNCLANHHISVSENSAAYIANLSELPSKYIGVR